MLGYVIASNRELKVREYELYRGYYCGICKCIGRKYGQIPRMFLSYDATFLAILLDSLDIDKEHKTREVCIANPIKKKTIVYSDNIEYSADVMLVLAWFKILDDIRDENKFTAKLIKFLYKRKFKKILQANEELSQEIEKQLEKLYELEKEKCDNLDEVSDCFANIMKFILTFGYRKIQKEENKNIIIGLEQIGYHLGRYIYIIDAFDDIKENLNDEVYNPVVSRFKIEKYDENLIKEIGKIIENMLLLSLDDISKAIDLLPIEKNKDILYNVVYGGLLGNLKRVLYMKENEMEEDDERSI